MNDKPIDWKRLLSQAQPSTVDLCPDSGSLVASSQVGRPGPRALCYRCRRQVAAEHDGDGWRLAVHDRSGNRVQLAGEAP